MMNNDNSFAPPTESATPAAVRHVMPSKNQTRASAMAESVATKAKWKTLVGEACALWPKIGADEMASAGGNFNRLAGMVQLRHRLSREESDRQVRAFFDKHYAVA